jgi:LacI family transcriptional regulator
MVKRPTIKDVAKKAGVSIATVSFVLNNRPGQAISERVRQKVWKAAEQLDYHPTAAAAGLARKRTHNVAIVFYRNEHLMANSFYSFAIQGAIKEAIGREYNLLFSFIEKEYEGSSDLPKLIRERNAEGALFVQSIHPELVKDIQARGVPVVAIDHYPAASGFSSIQIDNRRGGQVAAEHLLSLGHTDLGVLWAEKHRPSISDRMQGFIDTATEQGIKLGARSGLFEAKSLTFDSGYLKAKELFSKPKYPRALFCVNDEMAAGALRAAHEAGIRVPGDLSVVGFDDITMSNYVDPPLTTVGVDKESLGRLAMKHLLERVENRELAPATEVVSVALVERMSTQKA